MEFRAILIFIVKGGFPSLFVWMLPGCVSAPLKLEWPDLPQEARQVLQVRTDSWDASRGSLQRWRKDDSGKWIPVGNSIPVSVGRSGLAWGRGLHQEASSENVKREGDMKAPAGIFSLGTAFGYAESPPEGSRYPYRMVTEHDFFVDDGNSPEYNQWVRLPGGVSAAETRWKSFEKMRRKDGLYELGIVVNHNTEPAVPGFGSAIFLHLWRGPGQPTAGCTAMSRPDLVELLSWLESDAHPVLIQAPDGVF